MKQTTDLSTLVAGMVSEVVAGVITGVASARRLYYRNLFLVAIIVAGITLAIAFRDRMPSIDIRFPPEVISAPGPVKDPEPSPSPEPSPNRNSEVEELRRLTRPNPL
jgi:hypothetical protein